MWFRRPGTLSGPRRSGTSRSLPDLPACPAELAARRWANEGHPRDTLSRPARPPDRSWPVTRREERPRSLGRRDAGRNRLPGRQRAPSSRGDTLAGRAGGCPGRTPAEAYPASPTGQHCPLRPRPRPREHRPRFTRPARPPAHSWPGTGREGRPRSLGRRGAGRNRLPGRQRAPSSRGDTLDGRAGGCPGRTPPAVYPASPPGQHIGRFGRDTVPGRRRAEVYPASPPRQHRPPRPAHSRRARRQMPRANASRSLPGPARPPPLSAETPWQAGTL